jgi:hypothetical protein
LRYRLSLDLGDIGALTRARSIALFLTIVGATAMKEYK